MYGRPCPQRIVAPARSQPRGSSATSKQTNVSRETASGAASAISGNWTSGSDIVVLAEPCPPLDVEAGGTAAASAVKLVLCFDRETRAVGNGVEHLPDPDLARE